MRYGSILIVTTFPFVLIGLVSVRELYVRPDAIAESAEAPVGEVERA